jgi:hypothetical protein
VSQVAYSSVGSNNVVELLSEYTEMQKIIDETIEKYMPKFIKLILEKVDNPLEIEAWMEELKRCRNEDLPLETRYIIARAIQRKTEELELLI